MTDTEIKQLEQLLEIADEEDSPITAWEYEFLSSLDARRPSYLSAKQADIFDRLVNKHLRSHE